MTNPLVSIVVPCYNQAQYLDEALQSVLSQSYTQWECLIVDDGSNDNTQEIAMQWVSKDARFMLHSKENGGLCNTRNSGITKAIGKYILPLDADDKIGLDYISLAVDAINTNSEIKVVYCKAEKFGDTTGEWQLPEYNLLNLTMNNLIFCSAMFRKKDWELVGGYDEKMADGWEDWEFWIHLLKDGGKVLKLDYTGFYYRIKSSSMLQRLTREKERVLMEYLSVKHADFFVKQYGSFQHLVANEAQRAEKEVAKRKNKKHVIDLFFKTFFGFQIFNKADI